MLFRSVSTLPIMPADNFSSIIPADLQSKFEDICGKNPTSNDGKYILTPFIKLFQEFLSSIDDKFDDFKKVLAETTAQRNEFSTQVSLLKTENSKQAEMIDKLEAQLDDQDQYVRRESLVFSGDSIPAWQPAENCVDIVSKIITEKLGQETSISPADVSVAHRLGPKPTNSSPDRRSIIVRFCRRNVKYQIINKARKSKPLGLYVNESLTPLRQKITGAIRKAKREFPNVISGYNTVDGNISLYVKPPNPDAPGARNTRMTVNTMKALDDFCRKSFSFPATHFLESSNPRVAAAARQRDRPETRGAAASTSRPQDS